MNRPFEVRLPLEEAYHRRVLFAIELLDAVTLSRVSESVKVVAKGLQGKPIVNAGGLFVWLQEDLGNLRKVSIDPGKLPYEGLELEPAHLRLPPNPEPLTTVQLSPRVDYAFPAGATGLRGTLIEERVPQPTPVGDAEVRLRWLDDNGVWHDAPTKTRTDPRRGDFVSILRLSPTDVPELDKDGNVTVRLRARREANERSSADLKLLQGRVTDPSTANALTFAWDELQP